MSLKSEGHFLDVKEKTLILGMGNALRCDDGIGPAVVEISRKSGPLPDNITLIDAGTSDLEALLLMQGYQRVFVINAANIGVKPGEWRCIPIDDISFGTELQTRYESFHCSGLKDAIALGQTLNLLPTEVYIYAVQPQDLKITMNLCEPASIAVREIADDLLERLGRGLDHLGSTNNKEVEG